MEVSGQLQYSAALPPGKQPPAPTGQEWTLGRSGRGDEEKKSHRYPCCESNPGRRARISVTILNEISRLLPEYLH
jgi:hypothetical protein